MVADVPEPGRRHLLHSIAPGTPLSTCVELEMTGQFLLKAGARWQPMRARQIITWPDGFIWKASIGRLARVSGADVHIGGEGSMRWKLWNIFPLVKAGGPDISRSGAGRLLLEWATFLPATLLPPTGAEWSAVDDETASVTIPLHGESHTLTLGIDAHGALKSICMDRWGNYGTEGGKHKLLRFGGELTGESTFGGYTIPTEMRVGWHYGTPDYHEFFRADITSARFR